MQIFNFFVYLTTLLIWKSIYSVYLKKENLFVVLQLSSCTSASLSRLLVEVSSERLRSAKLERFREIALNIPYRKEEFSFNLSFPVRFQDSKINF